MDMKSIAAWDKFAQSGKICDYLQYKHVSQERPCLFLRRKYFHYHSGIGGVRIG